MAGRRWRIRGRLVTVITVAVAAPAIVAASWVVAPGTAQWSLPLAVAAMLTMTFAVSLLALAYGLLTVRRIVEPVEAMATALRRFDPSLGDVGHPALTESAHEPQETVELKRALRGAVERIGRDRAQKEVVLAGLMHDLKTPLLAQSLLIEQLPSLDRDETPVALTELARSAQGAVGRLNRLIDVLRVDASDAGMVRSEVEVRRLVDDTVAGLAPLARSRSVVVSVDGRWIANTEPVRVARAIENVLSNAVRHARSSVSVRVTPGLVSVSDDGPGFAVPFDEALDPFRPGPTSVDRPTGTAGLGLYIARRSLESLGGRVKLASSGPERTTVLLYLGAQTS